ncbi:ATP-binding domain-containing protein [Amycolatopsis sp. QT-25]|uniref:DEAD/DEAH box helicase n=1 Tax=Amycolatopsis sp. QT-25 TaxID=3034022 RepID=UPI0023EA9DB8|nr:ATP-binding domain-containing protein [Amycolatopsis sp. QT-25]WET80540.1 ATP-binding domain-containing protein [Amycolatopsis sp. QT-25]
MTTQPTIVRGTNDKPAASDSLAGIFESSQSLDGQLFIGYPIIGTADGKLPIDAVYVSPTRGVVVFDLVEGNNLSGFESRQDDAATKLESRLMQHRDLVNRRKLKVIVTPVTFAPAVSSRGIEESNSEEYRIANVDSLEALLAEIPGGHLDSITYAQTLSALQSISTIRKSRASRVVSDEKSRGARLKRLEESIATLDNQQSKAVIETVKGVQRIRGLAGSGKTIVLALKAAYLHAQHPDWKIAVTFQTRSLRSQFSRLINNFSIEQAGEEPDWDRLKIIHAWGAPGGGRREGIYHEFCVSNETTYYDFMSANSKYGRDQAFQGACREALAEATEPNVTYDAILVDEAQDFPPEFLNLCYKILTAQKRLVYAYDELQNLSSAGLPSAADIFGVDSTGTPRVSFDNSSQDVILEKCYRNSRPVLTSAHSLGFGIYRQPPNSDSTGLVQIFDQPELWNDIGYRVKSGQTEPGEHVVLTRPADTSPGFLEDHSPVDDLIHFQSFTNQGEQAQWVAGEIEKNLESDELRADDIVIINPNPRTARSNLGHVRKALFQRGIATHLAGVDVGADTFFRSDAESITCTGIFRAKGNEAGMVYIIDADECYESPGTMARTRNMLFTAITRSKAWVRVLGIGSPMDALRAEYDEVKAANFELRFRYPTDRERAQLQVVHRDMSEEELNAVRRQRTALPQLVEDLETGRVYLEDLDDRVVNRLQSILDRHGKQ